MLLLMTLLLLIVTGFAALWMDGIAFSGFVLMSHIAGGMLFCILFTLGSFFGINNIRKRFIGICFWCSVVLFLPVILSIAVMTFPVLDTAQMNGMAWVHHLSSFLFCIVFIPVISAQLRGSG